MGTVVPNYSIEMTTVGHFRNPENKKAEDYAESLGVVARYGNSAGSIYIAENFTEALTIVHRAGLKLPARITDEPRWFKRYYPFQFSSIHATTDLSDIRINSHSDYWEEHGERARSIAQRLFEAKEWSTHSELHVALHELMHTAQYLQNPEQWTTLHLRFFSEDERVFIFTHVGLYANSDVIEFLAEVGVGLLLGMVYPDEVMALYQSLGGLIR